MEGRSHRGKRLAIAVVMAAGALAIPALAPAHVERSSYWPEPGPDTSVSPPAGGEVPEYRSLKSALNKKLPGTTRVVCQSNSMKLAKQAIKGAVKNGVDLRPSQAPEKFTKKQGKKLKRLNRKFKKKCKYDEIQPAIDDSGNNDRVVIMPGVYTEPTARSQPTQDPKCAGLTADSDHGTGAVSYLYQATCPNDQNLIAIIGRQPSSEPEPPVTPDTDRHGIPNPGACIRCNLQIEGSGPGPDDVVIEAGETATGGQSKPVKDVALRADRADGTYIRNMTVRNAAEHGFYLIEVDGYVLERVKMKFNHEYGHLSFTSDHGLLTDCEATGSGDAGVYPGAAAQTGYQTREASQRYNQEIRNCDLHGNTLGHSGSMGDAIWIHDNEIYNNAVGISVDTLSAAGHPGFPQDSILVENNKIYSNNLNPFEPGSTFEPTVPAAVGTGTWIAGGNANMLRNNHIYDNWRRGVMLFAVPDALACAPGNPQQTCDEAGTSTSFDNRFTQNVMGVAPDGTRMPNGVDFWWDSFPGTTGNCWYDNTGVDGTQSSVTLDPSLPPSLPSDCNNSIGIFDAENENELLGCAAAVEGIDDGACPWFTTPPKP